MTDRRHPGPPPSPSILPDTLELLGRIDAVATELAGLVRQLERQVRPPPTGDAS